jgi:hypothetical protein
LNDKERKMLDITDQFYEITFSNKGGLVMPLILEFQFADGSSEIQRIPAEIWVKNSEEVTKVFRVKKEAVAIKLDPFQETADVDMDNNAWPAVSHPSRFQLFKEKEDRWGGGGSNPMQRAKKAADFDEEQR